MSANRMHTTYTHARAQALDRALGGGRRERACAEKMVNRIGDAKSIATASQRSKQRSKERDERQRECIPSCVTHHIHPDALDIVILCVGCFHRAGATTTKRPLIGADVQRRRAGSGVPHPMWRIVVGSIRVQVPGHQLCL